MGKIGRTNYGTRKRKNFWKLTDGESVYRILPPFGSLSASGRWSYWWKIHFGFMTSENRMKPFACIEAKDGNRMITQTCPVCEMALQLKADIEKMRQNNEPQNVIDPLKRRLRAIDADSKHYVNAMALDGSLGLLKLPTRAMNALKDRIESLRKQGIDPINPEGGVFFVFRRSGTGLDTVHQVDVYTETKIVEGETYNKIKTAPLTEEILSRIEGEHSEIFDLPTLYKKFTEEEVKLIVSGDPTVMDRLFSMPERTKTAPHRPPAPKPTVAQPIAPAVPTAAPAEETVAPARVEETKTETRPVAEAPTAEAPKVPSDVTKLSDEEFQNLFQSAIGGKQ